MRILYRIRQSICEQRYRISSHANEEMSEDELESNDIENIIFTGKIIKKYTLDPRGTRYEIYGNTTDGRLTYV